MPPGRTLELAQDGSFQKVWWAGAAASIIRWLEMLAVAVFVFELTASPFYVALVTVLRMLPLALLGVVFGAVVESSGRRPVLLFGLAGMVLVSAVLAALVLSGNIQLWHIMLGTLLSGIFWATDFPARRTLLGEIAGPERVGSAMSFDAITNNGTRMLGPALGGLLLEQTGLQGVYLLGVLLYGLGFFAILRLQCEVAAGNSGQALLSSILEGVRHVRSDRRLVGIMAVTVVFNLWAFPFTSMIPVIGKDVLALEPFWVGMLVSAEGTGAFIGAIMVAFFAPPRWYGKLYLYGTLAYLVTMLLFSHSPWFVVSALILLLTGFGAAAFASMQSTLVFLCAPAIVRSRVMGVLSVCIGIGPLGFLHLGLLADWIGAPLAVALVGAQGLIVLLLAHRIWPEIR